MLKDKIKKIKYENQKRLLDNNPNINIIISNEKNYTKIIINNYITFSEYKNQIGELDLINGNVLLNGKLQKVNKGTFYIISIDNKKYTILINNNELRIDEIAEKENITEEKILILNIIDNDYNYTIIKSEKNNHKTYRRYYSKNGFVINIGTSELTRKEALEGINALIDNIEKSEILTQIIDINLLKEVMMNDFKNNYILKKIKLRHK